MRSQILHPHLWELVSISKDGIKSHMMILSSIVVFNTGLLAASAWKNTVQYFGLEKKVGFLTFTIWQQQKDVFILI